MKIFARELLWLLIALLLCMPIAYLFGNLLQLKPENELLSMEEEVFEMELYLIGALVGIVCTYIMRIVMWAVAKYVINSKG